MASPVYEVTVTFTFTFDTSQYYDVDDGQPNFDPQDEESVLNYIVDNNIVDDELGSGGDYETTLKRVVEKGA